MNRTKWNTEKVLKGHETWHGHYEGERFKIFGDGYYEGFYTLRRTKKGIWQLHENRGYFLYENLQRLERQGKINNLLMHMEPEDGPTEFNYVKRERVRMAEIQSRDENPTFLFVVKEFFIDRSVVTLLYIILFSIANSIYQEFSTHEWDESLFRIGKLWIVCFSISILSFLARWGWDWVRRER